MKQRTQIIFDAEEHRFARHRASERGISLSEYVRQLVRRDRGETVSTRGASGLIGLGDSGGSDVARHKDEYVGEAVDAGHARQ